VKFVATKLVAVFGYRIRDPGWVKSGPGIRDKHPGIVTLVINFRSYVSSNIFLGSDEEGQSPATFLAFNQVGVK
jgi:hypothetical protein